MSSALRQHIEKLITLTDEEFDYVLSKFSTKKLKKHQFLVQEGAEVLNDYWVVKGLLKAYHADEDGKIHILQFAMEDWWISDYNSLVYGTAATINIDCIEDSELLVISSENRELLCNEMKGMANFFRKKSHAGYVALQQRILFLLHKNPQERYNRFLALNPKLLQRLPKTLLAAYIGVSRETLSRLSHP
ncbi:Crp/Fnr family transcriptional regulator [Pedobacter steynii]|uniref:Crp/Fnr family transcriptional regulator n=1 Tax=Pedobacter steynii TaxID=430522 RepID=A0A1D7QJE8_9SPHI|nr:Crp/Fnr family transcriptional regulator [Pedobacter steynii]AOM78743.1 Crp/Fnr family transcriptional regulator [Pedobacter steynii]